MNLIKKRFKPSLCLQLLKAFSKHTPRQFASINSTLDPSQWDYEKYKVSCGLQDDYEIFGKIGRGKYSEVFDGINVVEDQAVIVKILKPNQIWKMQREVLVLRRLVGHENIIKLKDVLLDKPSEIYSLVFEKIDNVDLKSQYDQLTIDNIRHIIYEVLKGLNFAHQRGIIHRDIKPQNIIVDSQFKTVKIIDWGLAEFYHLGKEYNVRVASRYFKPPELLLDFRQYNYSLDVWSLGAVLAGMIFQKEPFISGTSNDDQFVQTVKLLGSEKLQKYVQKYEITVPERYSRILGRHTQKQWGKFITQENKHLCSKDAIDLLDKMLVFDHIERITVEECLSHPFFQPLN